MTFYKHSNVIIMLVLLGCVSHKSAMYPQKDATNFHRRLAEGELIGRQDAIEIAISEWKVQNLNDSLVVFDASDTVVVVENLEENSAVDSYLRGLAKDALMHDFNGDLSTLKGTKVWIVTCMPKPMDVPGIMLSGIFVYVIDARSGKILAGYGVS